MVRVSPRSRVAGWPAAVPVVLVFLVALAALALTALGACAPTGPGPEGGGGPAPATDLPVTRLTPLGEDDGYLGEGEGVSPFTEDLPLLTRMDPELLKAVRAAATEARTAGVDVVVTSGWRSERYQQFLLDAAVTVYADEEEAARWVATPQASSHVSGEAVDIGRTDAADWMGRYGAAHGLCQTYANEMWHFELAVEPGGTCPAPRADASAG
ncbi:M15 family metallopeptidase [Nocardiopsis sp. NPDC058631]|uniref:M15 family metallopeptidase n=1 Tax=Nocardiopsis sp. NPDC058631 TaxID=3346566 RepID=UPI003646D36B